DDEFFQIHLIVSKCFLRLMTRAMESRLKAWLIMGGAHAATPATTSRLDHYRVAQFLSDFHRFFLCFHNSIAAWGYRDAGFACSRAGSVLVAHRLHRVRRWADELDVAAFADFHEMRVLGEESVPRVNRINVANLSRAHDPIDSQIT